MHAVSHSLAHRPPPATRTRVHWQPYNALPSSVSSRSPSTSFLSLCDSDHLRSSLPPISHLPYTSATFKRTSMCRFIRLVLLHYFHLLPAESDDEDNRPETSCRSSCQIVMRNMAPPGHSISVRNIVHAFHKTTSYCRWCRHRCIPLLSLPYAMDPSALTLYTY